MFVRYVVHARDEHSDHKQGVFSALYELEHAGKLAPYELDWFRSVEAWFDRNLKRPHRLAWSSRPHAPERAICWFKRSAREHVLRVRDLVVLLEHKDILVEQIRTDRPGYILYEDNHQVTAIPFTAETF